MGLPRVVILGGEGAGKSTVHSLLTHVWSQGIQTSAQNEQEWDPGSIRTKTSVEEILHLGSNGEAISFDMTLQDPRYVNNHSGLALIDPLPANYLDSLWQLDHATIDIKKYFLPDPLYPDLPRHHLLVLNLDILGKAIATFDSSLSPIHALINEELLQGIPLTIIWTGHELLHKAVSEGKVQLPPNLDPQVLADHDNLSLILKVKNAYTQAFKSQIAARLKSKQSVVHLVQNHFGINIDHQIRILDWDKVTIFEIPSFEDHHNALKVVTEVYHHIINTSYKPHCNEFMQLYPASLKLQEIMKPQSPTDEIKQREAVNQHKISSLLQSMVDRPDQSDALYQELKNEIPKSLDAQARLPGTPSVIVVGPGHSGKTTLINLLSLVAGKHGGLLSQQHSTHHSAHTKPDWKDIISMVIHEFFYLLPDGTIPKIQTESRGDDGDQEELKFDPAHPDNIQLVQQDKINPDLFSMDSDYVQSYITLAQLDVKKLLEGGGDQIEGDMIAFEEALVHLWTCHSFKQWIEDRSFRLRNPLGSTVLNIIPRLREIREGQFVCKGTADRIQCCPVKGGQVDCSLVFESDCKTSDDYDNITPLGPNNSVCINFIGIPTPWLSRMYSEQTQDDRLQYYQADTVCPSGAARCVVVLVNLDIFACDGEDKENLIAGNMCAINSTICDELEQVPFLIVWTGESALNRRLEKDRPGIEAGLADFFSNWEQLSDDYTEILPKTAAGLKECFKLIFKTTLDRRRQQIDDIPQYDIDQLLDLRASLPIIERLHHDIIKALLPTPEMRLKAQIMTRLMYECKTNGNHDGAQDGGMGMENGSSTVNKKKMD